MSCACVFKPVRDVAKRGGVMEDSRPRAGKMNANGYQHEDNAFRNLVRQIQRERYGSLTYARNYGRLDDKLSSGLQRIQNQEDEKLNSIDGCTFDNNPEDSDQA